MSHKRFLSCSNPQIVAKYNETGPILQRCMECQRGLATRKLSVCLSVRPSAAAVKRVDCDKTKESLSRFLYHTKDHLA